VLEAENPGCAAHIERTASRKTPFWKSADLKKEGYHRQHDGKTYVADRRREIQDPKEVEA